MAEHPYLVLVEWQDAIHITTGWLPTQTYVEMAKGIHDRKHYTCGFLIEETDDYFLIALDFTKATIDKSQDLVNMVQLIHKNMVTNLEMLPRVEESEEMEASHE